MRLTKFARDLRKNQTSEETLVWRRLRDRRFTGLKFRRQRPIGGYIADFYSAEVRLVIEIDGPGQEVFKQELHDIDRDCELAKAGVTVLRISSQAVHDEPTAVADSILKIVARLRKA